MDVHVGSMSDPPDVQGLAHFVSTFCSSGLKTTRTNQLARVFFSNMVDMTMHSHHNITPIVISKESSSHLYMLSTCLLSFSSLLRHLHSVRCTLSTLSIRKTFTTTTGEYGR